MGGNQSRHRRPKRQYFRLFLNGLSRAGKSTLVNKLGYENFDYLMPIFGVYTFEFRGITVNTWELGGRCKMGALYNRCDPKTDVYVYVVDSADRDRMSDVKEKLKWLISEHKNFFADIPLAIVCTKQDLDNAITVDEICAEIDLQSLLPDKATWKAFGTSATTGEGIDDVTQWIYDVLMSNESSEAGNSKQDKEKSSCKRGFPKYVEKIKKFFLET